MGRPRRLSLSQLLDSSRTALILLDSDHCIRHVSPGVQELTGWPAEALLGLRCEREAPRTVAPTEALACAVAPPAAVRAGSLLQQEAVLPHQNGTTLRVQLVFVPLRDDVGDTEAVQIAIQPAAVPATGTRRPLSQHLYAEINALRLDMRRRLNSNSCLGRCSAILKAQRQSQLVASSVSGFTVVGPEGSGRRHLARLIHAASGVADTSLAILNCPLLTTETLLTTLHQLRETSTARTRLPHQRSGLLFLADLDQLPAEAQQWLLANVCPPDRNIWLAGSSRCSPTLLRQEGILLPELAETMTTVEIHLPPLHARDDDVLLLSQQFIEESRRDHKTRPETLSGEVRDLFLTYRWPGNVRELRQVVTTACRSSTSAELQQKDLPFSFRAGQEAQRQVPATSVNDIPLESLMVSWETRLITDMLNACGGNKTDAARRLGMTRPKLYRRMKTLGLDPDDEPS